MLFVGCGGGAGSLATSDGGPQADAGLDGPLATLETGGDTPADQGTSTKLDLGGLMDATTAVDAGIDMPADQTTTKPDLSGLMDVTMAVDAGIDIPADRTSTKLDLGGLVEVTAAVDAGIDMPADQTTRKPDLAILVDMTTVADADRDLPGADAVAWIDAVQMTDTTASLQDAGACVAGDCTPCPTNQHACNNVCASNADPATCGTACTPCPAVANGTANCDGQSCGFTCNKGYSLSGSQCLLIPAPRQVAPLSTSRVTSQRPTLRWVLPSGLTGTRVEICSDRPCANILNTIDVDGTSVAPPSNLSKGPVFWRLTGKVNSILGTAQSPTWQFVVGALSTPVDTSSWGAPDFNNDGYADVAIGAPEESTGNASGYLSVYYGTSTGLSPSAQVLNSSGPVFFGGSVTNAGDVNGDGYADLVAGAVELSSKSSVWGSGRAVVYYGGASGLTGNYTQIDGPQLGSQFGRFLASAGDINGDGYADLAVGAPSYNSDTGRVSVFLGGAAGIGTTAAWTQDGPDGPGGRLGRVSSGDVNGDGWSDLMISAQWAQSNTGRAYLYLGGSSGLATTPSTTFTGPDGDGGNFFATIIGDVNGDGYTDVLGLAPGMAQPGIYFYLGGPGGVSTIPTTIITAPGGAVSTSSTVGSASGSASRGGDVNGDGYDDVVIGSPCDNTNSGRIFVYLGGPSGLSSTPAVTFQGGNPGDYFGYSVSLIGDIDKDGFGDLAVGTFLSAGYATIYRGTSSGASHYTQYTGSSASWFGLSADW
jgi:FG-GAP repeat/FG-GAP-like repeat